jgi:hypothetical protein
MRRLRRLHQQLRILYAQLHGGYTTATPRLHGYVDTWLLLLTSQREGIQLQVPPISHSDHAVGARQPRSGRCADSPRCAARCDGAYVESKGPGDLQLSSGVPSSACGLHGLGATTGGGGESGGGGARDAGAIGGRADALEQPPFCALCLSLSLAQMWSHMALCGAAAAWLRERSPRRCSRSLAGGAR